MNDSKSGPSADGRLTVVLFLLFGLLLFDFTYCHHWSFLGKNNGRNSNEQLSFVRPNKLFVENYSEAGSEQVHELVPAKYTPFLFELIPINSAGKDMLMTVKGIGGVSLSSQHAVDTAKVLNAMEPNQIAALTLMPLKNTGLGREVAAGRFILPSPSEILQELYLLISQLKNIRCQFHANHASSYLPLAGRLPKDKDALLASLEMAMDGATPLVPDYRRAL